MVTEESKSWRTMNEQGIYENWKTVNYYRTSPMVFSPDFYNIPKEVKEKRCEKHFQS